MPASSGASRFGSKPPTRRKTPAQQLGNAKVQQLWCALGRDYDVARLQVTMHYLALVGVLHCPAHPAKQVQPLFDRQFVSVAVVVNRLSFDVIHYQVGKTLFGGAAVEQFDDVGMVECGQRLALTAEAAASRLFSQDGMVELDGDAFVILIVGSDRPVDGSHG